MSCVQLAVRRLEGDGVTRGTWSQAHSGAPSIWGHFRDQLPSPADSKHHHDMAGRHETNRLPGELHAAPHRQVLEVVVLQLMIAMVLPALCTVLVMLREVLLQTVGCWL